MLEHWDDPKLQTLFERGTQEGCVELSDVNDLERRLGLGDHEADLLHEELHARGIDVRDDCGRAGLSGTTYENPQLAGVTADSLSAFLGEAGGHRLLAQDEEVALFKRIEHGDREARDRMVSSNLRLVISVARRFQGQGLPLIDLIQEGVLGLMRGIDGFDWRRGYKFSTYATWWIRQALQRAVANKGREIRLPLHIVDRERKLARGEQELSLELHRPPNDAELAARTGVPLRQIEELRGFARAVTSLEKPIGTEGESNLGDVLPASGQGPEEEVSLRLTEQAVSEAVAGLSEPERSVVRLRYGLGGTEPRTRQMVGQELGLTVPQVREAERRGLDRLAVAREVRSLREVA